MCPLFKKGSRDKPGNHGPVNLALVVQYLLENVLRDRINLHLERD